jgi:hypothetical protein
MLTKHLSASLVLAASASCTVGATLPFGVRSGGDGTPVASTDSYAETGGGGGDAARPACVRDRAGHDFASAGALAAGERIGCVDKANDNVYVLTAAADNPGGSLYAFQMTASEQICVKLYDQQRKQHGGGQCIEGAAPGTFWAAVAPGTKIYLRLERPVSATAPYRLEVAEKKLVDPEEPNSSADKATPLALGEEHHALMQMVLNDDSVGPDVYKVVVPKAGTLALALDPVSDDITAEASIFDSDRRQIARESASNGGAVLRVSAQVRPGTYYVKVGEFHDNTVVPYGIAGNGEAEPTSHFSKPYQISVELEGKHKRVSRR